ncbi:MAG: hypothetical protein HGA85_07960 [Nanoarchaeota archaeon]|nr:hypothetical protein [Nanoarchaeota archaeon]
MAIDMLPAYALIQMDEAFVWDCYGLEMPEDKKVRYAETSFYFFSLLMTGNKIVEKDQEIMFNYVEGKVPRQLLEISLGRDNLDSYDEAFQYARVHRNILQREHCRKEGLVEEANHYNQMASDAYVRLGLDKTSAGLELYGALFRDCMPK